MNLTAGDPDQQTGEFDMEAAIAACERKYGMSSEEFKWRYKELPDTYDFNSWRIMLSVLESWRVMAHATDNN